MENKISVIIPVFNAEKYLSECINSVLEQKFLHEIIIVNDGSKDKSSQICIEYQNNYPQIIKYIEIENHGASYARNIGINLATGDYIVFVDSDDTLAMDTFSNIVTVLKDNKCDIIFWGLTKQYSNCGSIAYLPKQVICNTKESTEKAILYLKHNKENFYYFGFSVNKVYKRSIIELYNIRFRDKLNIGEDEVFAMDYCIHINSIGILNKSFYNYRILNNSLTFKKKNITEYILIAELLLKNKDYWYIKELRSFDTLRAYQFALRGYFENPINLIFTNSKLRQILINTNVDSFEYSHLQYKPLYSKRIIKSTNKIYRFFLLIISHFIVNIKK